MKFQRDSRAPWRHLPRLVTCLVASLWRRDAAHRISMADAFRGIGAARRSLRLLEPVDDDGLDPGELARLRLVRATALQYVGSHGQARAIFEVSERDAPNELFLSFVLQHHGKCLVEAGELDLAQGKLAQALDLRRAHGTAALEASSLKALEALERLG